jgi:hypothetical protein
MGQLMSLEAEAINEEAEVEDQTMHLEVEEIPKDIKIDLPWIT